MRFQEFCSHLLNNWCCLLIRNVCFYKIPWDHRYIPRINSFYINLGNVSPEVQEIYHPNYNTHGLTLNQIFSPRNAVYTEEGNDPTVNWKKLACVSKYLQKIPTQTTGSLHADFKKYSVNHSLSSSSKRTFYFLFFRKKKNVCSPNLNLHLS